MKKILITGKNSYIGNALEKWLAQWPDQYRIEKISMRDDLWKQLDFSGYDAVVHVAGIAHVPTNHTKDESYFLVNRDLAVATAQKARAEGVRQFVFMSSGIIYGVDEPVGKAVVIDKDTVPKPKNAYGQSKLEADLSIRDMDCEDFHTVCVRTPMVYGAGCKGNFSLLARYADWLFLLPSIENHRSMIHIDNLTNFIKERIDKNDSGVFFPQNREWVSTNDIVSTVRKIHGKKTRYSRLLGWIVVRLSYRIAKIRKIYGDLAYVIEQSETAYIIKEFEKTIRKSI